MRPTGIFTGLLCMGLALQAVSADTDRLIRRANRYFGILPDTMPGAANDTQARIELGKKLFFDVRLSVNDTQSCASCHRLEGDGAGVDNLPTSPGATGAMGTRNTPTVLNAGWQRRQFWDGRAADLVEQAKGPILNPDEMAMPDAAAVENKLRSIEEYRVSFATAFPGEDDPVTFQNVAEAIAAFERTLRSESRFDAFLRGNGTALNAVERKGLETFIRLDCVSCHDGVLLGGESFETLGKENPYDNQADKGVFELTGDEDDRMLFKVASLRNVARTAPYFHDGRIKTLGEAVRRMAWLQVNEKLSDAEEQEIVAFLRTLSGSAPQDR